jgi:cardiolipin synthase
MTPELLDAIVAAARAVPADQLGLAASALDPADGWSNTQHARLTGACAAGGYQQHIGEVSRRWRNAPGVEGASIAAALHAAAAAVAAERATNKVSLVWTGPPSPVLGLRATRAVVDTIVARATSSLLLMSFAGYKVDDLVTSLAAAIERGVEVAFVLETHDDSGGDLSVDAAKAFTALAGRARFYRWPIEAREAYFAHSARLHAKCIVADRTTAFVTSANLTGAAINDNIELGVLIEAGPLPGRLHDHIDALIAAETLVPLAMGGPDKQEVLR